MPAAYLRDVECHKFQVRHLDLCGRVAGAHSSSKCSNPGALHRARLAVEEVGHEHALRFRDPCFACSLGPSDLLRVCVVLWNGLTHTHISTGAAVQPSQCSAS